MPEEVMANHSYFWDRTLEVRRMGLGNTNSERLWLTDGIKVLDVVSHCGGSIPLLGHRPRPCLLAGAASGTPGMVSEATRFLEV